LSVSLFDDGNLILDPVRADLLSEIIQEAPRFKTETFAKNEQAVLNLKANRYPKKLRPIVLAIFIIPKIFLNKKKPRFQA
jgi:hypothetical protein